MFLVVRSTFFYSSDRDAPKPLNGFSRSTRRTTCFRAKMCLLGVRCYLCSFKGSKAPKTPILGAWIGAFKPNAQNHKTWILSKPVHRSSNFLHSDKDHQVLFVGGPNTLTINPKWRTAAILKNRKCAISQQQFGRSWWNLAGLRRLGLPSVSVGKNWIFENPRWRRPPFLKVWF